MTYIYIILFLYSNNALCTKTIVQKKNITLNPSFKNVKQQMPTSPPANASDTIENNRAESVYKLRVKSSIPTATALGIFKSVNPLENPSETPKMDAMPTIIDNSTHSVNMDLKF